MYKFAEKKIKKIYKDNNSLYNYCIGVGSLSKVKDATAEIKKILENLSKEDTPYGKDLLH